jgi:putative hydrolase of the HAD superfamily
MQTYRPAKVFRLSSLRLSSESIQGVFFSYGGVIETVSEDRPTFRKGLGMLQRMLQKRGVRVSAEDLERYIGKGLAAYEKWLEQNDYCELPCERLWTDFLLRDLGGERLGILNDDAAQLSAVLEFYLFKRRPVRGVVQVVRTLYRNRMTLAVVSNSISSELVPERLEKFGIDRYFSSVVLSVTSGVRKPHPMIFQDALAETGLAPDQVLFVGDTVSRDVEGARRAGIGRVALLRSPVTDLKDAGYPGSAQPDQVIDSLDQIYDMLKG